MTCAEARSHLLAGQAPPAGDAARHAAGRHAAGCAACSRFAARLATAREWLRDHHLEVEPDAGFADRVLARIARPQELIGRAALRLLPAALALALVLASLALGGLAGSGAPAGEPAGQAAATRASTDDVLIWLADLSEVER